MSVLGNVYSYSFSAVAATGADKDIFDLVGSTSSRWRLTSLLITKSTIGSTEGVPVQVWRGSTLSSTAAGIILAPTKWDGRSSSTSSVVCNSNSTAPGSSGTSAALLIADALNDYHPFYWEPYRDEVRDDRPVFGTNGSSAGIGERLQVRLKASLASIQVNGTIIIEEIGLV